MPFFQNVFNTDFIMPLSLGDRHYAPNFKLNQNYGRGQEIVTAWHDPAYNLSGNDSDGNSSALLQIAFAIDVGTFKNWAYFSVDITSMAASTSSVTSDEIVAALNANTTFAGKFSATIWISSPNNPNNGLRKIQIRQTKPVDRMKFYIVNGGAEEKLGFNARAGVAELPSFFTKHTIANRFTYPESIGSIILLNAGVSNVDNNIIDNAVDAKGNSLGYSHGAVKADWQLFKGTSGLFNFQKLTLDGNDRITQIIEYPCGAVVGDFGRKINYVYSGTNTNPIQITEIPYTLTSMDLVSPP